jgi:hypothetical protein
MLKTSILDEREGITKNFSLHISFQNTRGKHLRRKNEKIKMNEEKRKERRKTKRTKLLRKTKEIGF